MYNGCNIFFVKMYPTQVITAQLECNANNTAQHNNIRSHANLNLNEEQ